MHSSASALFPKVVPAAGEVPELRRAQQETARFAERQIIWNEHAYKRDVEIKDLVDAERQRVDDRFETLERSLSAARDLVDELARDFRSDLAERKEEREKDRAERRHMLSRAAWLFGAIIGIVTLGSQLWFGYRADVRERERDARDLAAAVERAQHNRKASP